MKTQLQELLTAAEAYLEMHSAEDDFEERAELRRLTAQMRTEGTNLSFQELEAELQETPMTWVPALLRTLIRTARAKKVFIEPDGLLTFVRHEYLTK